MLKGTKFYRPRKARMTEREELFIWEGLSGRHARGTDEPRMDFKLMLDKNPLRTRRIAPTPKERGSRLHPSSDEYQITYFFTSAIRNNMFANIGPNARTAMLEYGAKGWSFRLLYEFLSNTYNGGIPFIDTYFERIFRTRSVYFDYLNLYNEVRDIMSDAVLKKDGTPDMRFNVNKTKVKEVRNERRRVGAKIRKDVEVCLSTGIIPLSGRIGSRAATNTRLIRSRLGGMQSLNSMFYASGSLIQDLNIEVEVAA